MEKTFPLQNQDGIASIALDASENVEMADYPIREYSKRQIKDAGQMLAEEWSEPTPELIQAFKIAHNWRMAHAFPLVQERKILSRITGGSGDTAGRIKRMDSIRKKLGRSPVTLDRMQDFAGIRAIVSSVQDVDRIAAWYRAPSQADRIIKENDYIRSPKPGGYRSLHIIRRYDGSGDRWLGQRVEIQIRSKFQHIWATAGEAIGAIRGEDLKAGEGNKDWLQLLNLMSAYFSEIEQASLSEHVPQSKSERQEEITHLIQKLDAINSLSALRSVVHGSDQSSAGYFLVTLDAKKGEISVRPKASFLAGSDELEASSDSGESLQTVMVAVDGLAALKRAYPNYFLDIGEFLDHLLSAASGKAYSEPVKAKSFIDNINTDFLNRIR